MSVTLLVVHGPYVGRQIQVVAGQTVLFGRTDRCDQAFPKDTYLSGAHFEVGWDEQECRVRDLGSSNGTFVNGTKIAAAAVREGDQVAAGETIFLVQAAGQEQVVAAPALQPPPAGEQVSTVERTARMYAPGFKPASQDGPVALTNEHKRALHVLTHPVAPLFTVIDARDAMALDLLRSSPLRRQALFEVKGAEEPAAHRPVLVELGQAGSSGVGTAAQAFLETLLHSGWGRSWGIFCTSQSPFEDLLEHFRGFLLVRTKEQRSLYFRFYDPRVLRAFLPLCEPEELSALFGPVTSFLVESENPDLMLAFSCGADGLITAQVLLAEESAQAHAG